VFPYEVPYEVTFSPSDLRARDVVAAMIFVKLVGMKNFRGDK
jgi:hypothetical protein